MKRWLYAAPSVCDKVVRRELNCTRPLLVYSYGRRSPGLQSLALVLVNRYRTNFLNLLALGRRQPPYIVLRLRGDLCFW